MTVRRAQILQALADLVAFAQPFPSIVDLDAPQVTDFSDVPGAPGLEHGCAIDGGKFEGTRDAGPVDQWEGVRDVVVGYDVEGADDTARRARAAMAVPALEQLVDANRSLGLNDPQVWAEIGDALEGDVPSADGAPVVSRAVVTINVTYVAASAAG